MDAVRKELVEALRERVDDFHALELPAVIHVAVGNLVHDLWSAVADLSTALARAEAAERESLSGSFQNLACGKCGQKIGEHIIGADGSAASATCAEAAPEAGGDIKDQRDYTAAECAGRLLHLANHAVKDAEWIHKPLSKLYRRAAELLATAPEAGGNWPLSGDREVIRLAIAAFEKCALPCACYRNPHSNDCEMKARQIEAALRAAAPVPTDTVTNSSGCVFCDLRLTLHEDEQGFHHVANGGRVDCKRSAPAPTDTGEEWRKTEAQLRETIENLADKIRHLEHNLANIIRTGW